MKVIAVAREIYIAIAACAREYLMVIGDAELFSTGAGSFGVTAQVTIGLPRNAEGTRSAHLADERAPLRSASCPWWVPKTLWLVAWHGRQ